MSLSSYSLWLWETNGRTSDLLTQIRAQSGCKYSKYMNVSNLLVHNISDCLLTAVNIFDRTRERKRIRYHQMKFARNFCLHLHPSDIHSGPFSIYGHRTAPSLFNVILGSSLAVYKFSVFCETNWQHAGSTIAKPTYFAAYQRPTSEIRVQSY